MRRRLIGKSNKLQLFYKRFYPAGNYTWTVPAGCTEIDVFLVGGGGGGSGDGGGGAYYGASGVGGDGGDGTVLIRYWAYEE